MDLKNVKLCKEGYIKWVWHCWITSQPTIQLGKLLFNWLLLLKFFETKTTFSYEWRRIDNNKTNLVFKKTKCFAPTPGHWGAETDWCDRTASCLPPHSLGCALLLKKVNIFQRSRKINHISFYSKWSIRFLTFKRTDIDIDKIIYFKKGFINSEKKSEKFKLMCCRYLICWRRHNPYQT